MHDLFLSFRGADTRYTFTDHLYSGLQQAGVRAFIDHQELSRGEDISAELVQAIQGSRISLIIFSANYAESRWCLEELVTILECRERLGQMVFPIFYHVDPSHVRNQAGSFSEAFQKHEARYEGTDKVSRWRAALSEAANLSDWSFSDGNDVRMVGIWGMGGIGKTSVAKAIYNKFYHHFESKSFIANVREVEKDSNGMITLQERLLSDILKPTKIEVGNVPRGINVIKERLGGKKVLVIVDDVDHVDQLNALTIRRDSFGPGSRIIITTRDRHLLELLKVDKIHLTQEMNEEEALELFRWHAFQNHCPNDEYFELSRSVVTYCGGLLLALEVLGSFLCKRSIRDWKSTLEQLKKIPHDEIQKKLRISFDAIDENQREIFLNISCFFIGMGKNYVTKILVGCGFSAEIGISVLLQWSLVTVSEKNKLMMNDLLRDMGREVVRGESPNRPEKCSRLWRQEDVIDVLTEESVSTSQSRRAYASPYLILIVRSNAMLRKSIATLYIIIQLQEGLALNLQRSNKNTFSTKAFRYMKRLKLIQLNYVQLSGDYNYLSKKLRLLCWRGFSANIIQNELLNQRNLVSIDMRYNNLIQLWEHSMFLETLNILNLSHSHYLPESQDFSKLPNLEYLILKDCKSLSEVHQSIGLLERFRLSLVNLKDCKMFKDLPRSFYKLKLIETIVLSGCSRFENLDEDIGEIISLTTLLVSGTSISELPSSIRRLKNLNYSSQ
ncbi:hypothetical protein ABKV19_004513 [Rosa sericea]